MDIVSDLPLSKQVTPLNHFIPSEKVVKDSNSMMISNATFTHNLKNKMVNKKEWILDSFDNQECMSVGLSTPKLFGNIYLRKNPNENAVLKEMFKKMGDKTVDVLDMVMAGWIEKDHMSTIYINDFLKMSGKKPNKNGSFSIDAKEEMEAHLVILSNFWTDIKSTEFYELIGSKAQRTEKPHTISGSILNLSGLKKHGIKDENGSDVMVPFAFIAQPGPALLPFLQGPNKQFALMTKKILSYDPIREFMEKRIGRYLVWQFRIRQRIGDYLRPYSIQSILDQASIKLDKTYGSRNREKIENLFDKLKADGIIRNWQYSVLDENTLSGKNWFDLWVQQHVIFEPPAFVLKFNEKIKNLQADIPNMQTIEICFAVELKSFLEINAISQLKLAELLNISPQYLSMFLSGKRSPSKKVLSAFEQLKPSFKLTKVNKYPAKPLN